MAAVPTEQNGIAYSYVRCSSPEQLKGHSIERQLERAEEYCKENKLKLSTKGYRDLGVSAFRGKNTAEGSELHALIDAIKAKRIPAGSTLIIENLDRLSRDFITESLPLFMSILRAGIFIVTLTDKRVWSTESVRNNNMELMFSIMILSRSHEESKRKSDLIGRAWKAAQANAKTQKIKTSYPGWLKLENNEFRVVTGHAWVIRTIFKQYLEGKGTNAIARDLNSRGIPTFTGQMWAQTTVKFYLRFPAVMGEYHAGQRVDGKKVKTGQVIKDYYPAIIDAADFYRVQAKLKLNVSKRGRPQREDANLFTGIIQCGYCGKSMGIYNAASSNSFVCWNAVSGGCIRVAYPAQDIELWVMTALEQIRADWYGRKADSAKVEELEGRLLEIDDKIQKMIAVIEAVADVAQIVTHLKALKTLKSTITAELETQKELNKVDLEAKPVVWSAVHTSQEDRLSIKPFIAQHIKCVKVYPAGDKKTEYQRRLKEFADKGISGSRCYHILRKELEVEWSKYFTLELANPITYEGKTGTLLRIDAWGHRDIVL